MASYRVLGRVKHIGPNQFFAIASGVPEVPGNRAIVLTTTSPSLSDSNKEEARLMVEVGVAVRARGDRVGDVES